MNEHDREEEVERLSNPDPFELPRRVKQKLRGSQGAAPVHAFKYLWLYVSRDGLHIPGEAKGAPAPTLEQWLALVDEAATLGVERMVITALSDLSQLPDIWEICHWAQDGHDITVGIHVLSESLPEATVEQIKQLDLNKFRLFVPEEYLGNYASLEADGIKVRPAKPAVETSGAAGEGVPHSVLFVNPGGQLYMAGSDGGAQPEHRGNIYEDLLGKVLREPKGKSEDKGGGIPSLAGFPYRD